MQINGPSEIRYNELAQFRCSANRNTVELEWKLDHQRIKSDIGKVELILQPGQISHGEREITLQCSGINENNDLLTVTHTVQVLCKYQALGSEKLYQKIFNLFWKITSKIILQRLPVEIDRNRPKWSQNQQESNWVKLDYIGPTKIVH